MLAQPASRPAADYPEALARIEAFKALDDASILPEARTALLDCGHRTPLAVVLFHGFTNNPAQYSEFAPMVRAHGVNVFVPRMPEHGDRNRLTPRLKNLTAEALLASASEAVDIAFGLGERVALLGISMGATLAAYFAQYRSIDTAVPFAPDFALLQLPYAVSHTLCKLVSWFPNAFLWWDPRLKAALQPHTAYPRFSTHALMQTMRIGDEVYRAADRERQAAQRIVTIVNRCDPAVNNEATQSVADAWRGWNAGGAEYVVMRTLPQ
ncbi:MAG TPA: alpha/beta fold hydrolase, partial [Verrucomicrobiae bacterium]|nr:alpha/beta fold hydrolase [Verrucomicrobiae bacterium]